MDALFTDYSQAPEWTRWVVAVGMLVGVLAIVFAAFASETHKWTSAVLTTVGVVGLLSAVVGVAVSTYSTAVEREDSAQAVYQARQAWVESHGVNTTKSTMSELEFPSIYEKPEDDENYGLAQVTTADREVITVTLAWEDGEFVLYGTDGQPMEALDK